MEGGLKPVTKLNCRVCTAFRDMIISRKNLISGSVGQILCVLPMFYIVRATSDQHVHAINLLRKQQVQAQGMSVTTYAPIAQSLNTLCEDEWLMIYYGRSLVHNKIDSAQTNHLHTFYNGYQISCSVT